MWVVVAGGGVGGVLGGEEGGSLQLLKPGRAVPNTFSYKHLQQSFSRHPPGESHLTPHEAG